MFRGDAAVKLRHSESQIKTEVEDGVVAPEAAVLSLDL
jgi:hypothetical protein